MWSSVNYIYCVVHLIPSAYLSYNWEFVPFNHLHPATHPFPISGNHEPGLFFYECLSVFEVQLPYNTISSWYTAQ